MRKISLRMGALMEEVASSYSDWANTSKGKPDKASSASSTSASSSGSKRMKKARSNPQGGEKKKRKKKRTKSKTQIRRDSIQSNTSSVSGDASSVASSEESSSIPETPTEDVGGLLNSQPILFDEGTLDTWQEVKVKPKRKSKPQSERKHLESKHSNERQRATWDKNRKPNQRNKQMRRSGGSEPYSKSGRHSRENKETSHMTQEEVMAVSLFVGDIGLSTKGEDLREYFNKFGDVKKMFLKPVRGYGFLHFAKASSVTRVLKAGRYHIIKGNRHEIKSANQAENRKSAIKARQLSDDCKLFIGGIPEEATDAHVRSFCKDKWGISIVAIVLKANYGFVTLARPEDVDKIMSAAEPFLVMGQPVFIGKFKTVVKQQQAALNLAKKKAAEAKLARDGKTNEDAITSSTSPPVEGKGASKTASEEADANSAFGTEVTNGSTAAGESFSLFNFDFSTPMPGLLDISSMWEGGSSSGFSLFGGFDAPKAAKDGGRGDTFTDLATSMAVSVIGTSPTNPPVTEKKMAPKRTSAPPGFSDGNASSGLRW